MKVVNFGVLTNYDFPPFHYPCGSRFLIDFVACLKAASHPSNSTSCSYRKATGVCEFPGPGLVPEIVARFIENTMGELDVVLHEFEESIASSSSTLAQFVQNGTVDLWLNMNTITASRLESGIKFTYPAIFCARGFMSRYDSIFTTDPGVKQRLLGALAPFTPPVWMCLLMALTLFALSVTTADKVARWLSGCKHTKIVISQGFWMAFNAFASNSFDIREESHWHQKLRSYSFVVVFFSAACFLLQSVYSNLVTSSILLPLSMRKRFSSATELAPLMLYEGYTLVHEGSEVAYWDAYRASSEPGIKLFVEALKTRSIVEADFEKAVDMLLQSPTAVYCGRLSDLAALALKNRAICKLLNFEKDDNFRDGLWGFFVNHRKAWFSDRFSAHLQTPAVSVLVRKYNLNSACDGETRATAFESMKIEDFLGVVVVLLIGVATSVLVLLAEISIIARFKRLL